MIDYENHFGSRFFSSAVDLSEALRYAMHTKRYEPVERLHDFYGHHGHRFPIKGGISLVEVMKRQLCSQNPLLKRLQAKRP